jgi:hypothetical protein
LSPDISTFFGLYNAFILGFSLASRYGGGWHAQNGMEMDDLCFFFRFELALLRWICWLDWLSGSEEHQKILWGCMHEAGVGGKTLHLGLLSYLRLGA